MSRERLVVGLTALGMAVCVAVAMMQSGDGTQLALIPTAIAVGVKFFGSNKGDPDTALSDDPAVALVLSALTTGDTSGADDNIDPNAVAYMNGVQFINPDEGNSPAQFSEQVDVWHSQIPNLSIDVYGDVTKKHFHRTKDVAVRFVLSGMSPDDDKASDDKSSDGNGSGDKGSGDKSSGDKSSDGNGFQVEGAAFVRVVDGKATEWRVIIDSQVADDLIASLAAGDGE